MRARIALIATAATVLLIVNIAQAQVKRTPDGKPDLSGVWSPEPMSAIKSQAKGLLLKPVSSDLKRDPDLNCTYPGVPRIDFEKQFKILQSSDELVILYQDYTTFRQIFTDGRPLPEDPQLTWLGYSVGKWDGDTLVVDSSGFNNQSWLDRLGTPHSDVLHVTERFHRRDSEHLDIQVTINDAKTFSRPLTVIGHARLEPNAELTESICLEERGLVHARTQGQ